MDISKTVFSISGIFKRMPKRLQPKKQSEKYLFAKGVYGTLNNEQIQYFKNIVENDYSLVKQFISQAEKHLSQQSKTK